MAELNRVAHQWALEGLRQFYPQATETELGHHQADLLLGRELAAKVYGPRPLSIVRERLLSWRS